MQLCKRCVMRTDTWDPALDRLSQSSTDSRVSISVVGLHSVGAHPFTATRLSCRCLKKVQEGIDEFDQIWQKVCLSSRCQPSPTVSCSAVGCSQEVVASHSRSAGNRASSSVAAPSTHIAQHYLVLAQQANLALLWGSGGVACRSMIRTTATRRRSLKQT